MEGCFLFQWGGVVFQMRGASFLSGGGGGAPQGGRRVWGGGGGGGRFPKKLGCPKRMPKKALS